MVSWGYSSVAEHSTADREVAGSTPAAPFLIPVIFFSIFTIFKISKPNNGDDFDNDNKFIGYT